MVGHWLAIVTGLNMLKRKINTSTNRGFTIFSAFAAFLLWGGWAYYLSYDKSIGITSGIVSGLTQGIASFIITLFMVKTVTWLFKRMPQSHLGIVLSALATVCFTGSCLYLAHFLVGTENIVLTIIFPLSVAFAFCLTTAYRLKGRV